MALKNTYVFEMIYINEKFHFDNEIEKIRLIVGDDDLNSYITKEISFDDAYHRIDSISGNKEGINITLGIYIGENEMVKLDSKKYHFVPEVGEESANYHKQGYIYLKTLEEYRNAIDV